MKAIFRVAQVGRECVACGCCVSVCPKAAIRIESGVIARIDAKTCIGCGKCAKVCPAAVITVVERRAAV
ncbi:4Fe-4S dicluster domain-containing protein [Hydrogenoanaerobacterium sp.]|uniref:4Fe-4S dicluster domain-containing protein n=1 Tax=Hydrogenoanaerobacterium sp. TaxID=2953763 RepID=UPI00289A7FD3|nr:4Fe-4S dicluster domain-containing protein [Hydrogenoanaerobacterium sp.]